MDPPITRTKISYVVRNSGAEDRVSDISETRCEGFDREDRREGVRGKYSMHSRTFL